MASNNNKKSGIELWMIVLGFILCWPVGLVLLLLKLTREDGAAGTKTRGSTANRPGAAKQTAYDELAQEAYRQAQSKYAAARQGVGKEKAPAGKKVDETAGGQFVPRYDMTRLKEGKALTVVGIVLMALFGFSTAIVAVESLVFLPQYPLFFIQDVFPPFLFTGIGALLFSLGRLRKGKAKRQRRCITLIGKQPKVSLTALAQAYPMSWDKMCAMLEDMIERGIFPAGTYLDYGRDLLVLDGSGLAGEEKKAAATPGQEEQDLLAQIRRVNEAIADEEMSRKIDRVGEITERILEFQKEHPEKSGDLRKFLNYYLPTTLKILRTYAELEKQGIDGANITATRQRIEGMMDMVVEGFERQLDKLFAGDMMDIAADITVMEQMMEGDGLFQKDGPTAGGL